MNKTCTICDVPFKEYVPHNSRSGEPDCEWLCFSGCTPDETTKETTPGNQSGLIEWPNDWDVTWTALRAQIEEAVAAEGNSCGHLNNWKVRVIRDGVELSWQSTLTPRWYVYDYMPTPTRSAPVNAPQGSQATSASSPIQHTPQSLGASLSTSADGSLQLGRNPCAEIDQVHTLLPREGRPLRTSDTPRLESQIVIDHMNRLYSGDCPECYRGCSEEDWMAVIGLV